MDYKMKMEQYSVAEEIWDEGLGNHRVRIHIEDDSRKGAFVRIHWRRRDHEVRKRRLILSTAEGTRIKNLHRLKVSGEMAELLFQPRRGCREYYLYFLPFKPQKTDGYFSNDYLKRESGASPLWLASLGLSPFCSSLPEKLLSRGRVSTARVRDIQSRTSFDSFFPMEIPLKAEEYRSFREMTGLPWSVAAEYREFPVKMSRRIPCRWMERQKEGSLDLIEAEVCRNEYFAFQIALFSEEELSDIRLEYPKLSDQITPSSFVCYNREGVDIDGKDFIKTIHVAAGRIQPLWMGIDIPSDMESGRYEGTILLRDSRGEERVIRLSLKVRDELLEDRGDSRPENFSRIRWMNSRIALDDSVISPYKALTVEDRRIGYDGKIMDLGRGGLPAALSAEEALLKGGVSFKVEGKDFSWNLNDMEGLDSSFIEQKDGLVCWEGSHEKDSLGIRIEGRTEADGYSRYDISLSSREDLQLHDLRLEIPFLRDAVPYVMGMGCRGGNRPRRFKSSWKGPWNSFWAGDINGGLHCTFLGSSYEGPMQNLYKPAPPPSWYNRGRGRILLQEAGDRVTLSASSGKRLLKAGETLRFSFSLLLTPLRNLDSEAQFRDRYYHSPDSRGVPAEGRLKVANIHHANEVNPYINYPFLRNEALKERIREYGDMGMKTKIYYTVRELTNRVAELPFLLSLGDEVLTREKRKGVEALFMKAHPWLREHIDDGFGAEWYACLSDGTVDAALLTSGESRWYNYYLEGLNWMVRNLDIDGLYLDDVSYDRRILKRMRRILDQKPGCLMDLHSNTGFSKGPAVQYTGFFPYINKVWFGESFNYNAMSEDQWLVESSGIPFGHMGDMLQDGGNRWRGMVYGMTVRLPWVSEKNKANPLPVWKIWDDFGIQEARMSGYWEKDCPVRCSHDKIKATAYIREDRVLIAAASWEKRGVDATLIIDWKALGRRPENTVMRLPAIPDFQNALEQDAGEPLRFKPAEGFLIYLEDRR